MSCWCARPAEAAGLDPYKRGRAQNPVKNIFASLLLTGSPNRMMCISHGIRTPVKHQKGFPRWGERVGVRKGPQAQVLGGIEGRNTWTGAGDLGVGRCSVTQRPSTCPSQKPTALGPRSPKSASAPVPDVALEKLLPLGQPGFFGPRGLWLWPSRLGVGHTSSFCTWALPAEPRSGCGCPPWLWSQGAPDGQPLPAQAYMPTPSVNPLWAPVPGNAVTTAEASGRLLPGQGLGCCKGSSSGEKITWTPRSWPLRLLASWLPRL